MTSQTKAMVPGLENDISQPWDLTSSYKLASLDLLECGEHIPGADSTVDKDMTERENRLLSRQDDILARIAALDISSAEDANILANFWMDLHKSDDNERPSDKLVMSLCRYIQAL